MTAWPSPLEPQDGPFIEHTWRDESGESWEHLPSLRPRGREWGIAAPVFGVSLAAFLWLARKAGWL